MGTLRERWEYLFSILFLKLYLIFSNMTASVGDPDPEPDPQDLHVFWPSGSGSISQRYGSRSGSGSFPFLINVLSGLK